MLVLTVAANATEPLNLAYTPQYLGIYFGADGTVSQINGTTQGKGTSIQLDATGVNTLGRGGRPLTRFSGTARMALIPLADGVLVDRKWNGKIAAGAGAAGLQIYAFGRHRGTQAYYNTTDTIKAGTMTRYSNFFFVGGAFTSNDDLNIVSRPLRDANGRILVESLMDTWSGPEAAAYLGLQLNNERAAVNDLIGIDNWNQDIDRVDIRCDAETTTYITAAF